MTAIRDPRCRALLDEITQSCREILGGDLVGVYVHGSLAFGCFRWETSDVDLMIVTERAPTQRQKERLIADLLRIEQKAPKKGLETSVVLKSDCLNFRYPTPYSLHYSVTWRERCKADPGRYCREKNGADPDLAAHFRVISRVGIVWYGAPIDEVFAKVPDDAFLDSIRLDVADAETDILQNPVYVILNLCRVAAFVATGEETSKEGGARWGISCLPTRLSAIVRKAEESYLRGAEFAEADDDLIAFAIELKRLAFANAERGQS